MSSFQNILKFGGAAWSAYQGLEFMAGQLRAREHHANSSEQHRYTVEQQRRILESLDEAARIREFVQNPVASDKLGSGRLGTAQDAQAAGLTERDGIYLGVLDGQGLFYNGDGHLLTYGRTRSGKGRDVILPNLAHLEDRSLVVADPKNGENTYASVRHRARNLGTPCVALNPWGMVGAPSVRVNPLQRIIDIARSGDPMDVEPYEIAMTLVPPSPKSEEKDSWVKSGAQELLALCMKHLAYSDPENCTLATLWRYVNSSDEELTALFEDMIASNVPGISGRAARSMSVFKEAPKQFEAIRDEMATALRVYEPGSVLAAATSHTEFDFAALKRKPHTVYLMVPERKLGAAAQWIALMVNHILEEVANAPGSVRTTFILDEFANLPYMPGVIKALRLYAGLGVQLWPFCQGRFSLEQHYRSNVIKELEDQADILQMWSVEDPSLLKDVELWSGKRTVAVRGVNNSGGQVASAAFSVSEHARPVLQIEEIRSIGQGQQILRVPGFPLFVANRYPWFRIDPWKNQLRDPRQVTQDHPAQLPAR